MNELILKLVLSAAALVAEAVDAIIDSATMTTDEKRAALDALDAKLELTKARVAAVKFREP